MKNLERNKVNSYHRWRTFVSIIEEHAFTSLQNKAEGAWLVTGRPRLRFLITRHFLAGLVDKESALEHAPAPRRTPGQHPLQVGHPDYPRPHSDGPAYATALTNHT